jgi:hypothetical protein
LTSDFDSANRFFDQVNDIEFRLGQYLARSSYVELCALLQGLDIGMESNILPRFRLWLSDRFPEQANYGWQSLIALDHFDSPAVELWDAKESEGIIRRALSLLREFQVELTTRVVR